MNELLRILAEAGIDFSFDEPQFQHVYERNRLGNRERLVAETLVEFRARDEAEGHAFDEAAAREVAEEQAEQRVIEDSVQQYLTETGRLGPVVRSAISRKVAERLATEQLTPEQRSALQEQQHRLARLGAAETQMVTEAQAPLRGKYGRSRIPRALTTGLATGAAQIPALLARPLPGVTAKDVMLGAEDIAGLPGGVQSPGEHIAEMAGFGAATALPGVAGARVAGAPFARMGAGVGRSVIGTSPVAEGISAGIRNIPRGATEGLGFAATGMPEATIESFEEGGLPGGAANLGLMALLGAGGRAAGAGLERGTDIASFRRGGAESVFGRSGAPPTGRQSRLMDLLEQDPTLAAAREGQATSELLGAAPSRTTIEVPEADIATGRQALSEEALGRFQARPERYLPEAPPERPLQPGAPDPLSALEQQLGTLQEQAVGRQESLAGEQAQDLIRRYARSFEGEPGATQLTLEQTENVLKEIGGLRDLLARLRQERGGAPQKGAGFRGADILISRSRGKGRGKSR